MQSIYVGNLNYSTSSSELQELFENYGAVNSVKIINDRDTGRSKGFGFVEMDKDSAQRAIEELDGREVKGRALKVNPAKPRKPRTNNYNRY